MNIKTVDNILNWLAEQSVDTICLCPGGRNAPFVAQLEKSQGFEVLSFYDERSAGFFALGRARRDQKPVAIITTSGTAVTEVMSSVVEASYTETPLVVITADRPKKLRGTGAPQAINQDNIYGEYVAPCIDIDAGESVEIKWDYKKPIHINICFDEPLFKQSEVEPKKYIQKQYIKPLRKNFKEVKFKNPLLVLGGMNDLESKNIESCLSHWVGPIYAESLSGLKGSKILEKSLIKSGDKFVGKMLRENAVDSVIRIGDVPVGRYWRDLDAMGLPVVSISSKAFKGSALSDLIFTDLEKIIPGQLVGGGEDWNQWKSKDQCYYDSVNNLVDELPYSEVSFYKKIVGATSGSNMVYVGNSLPVRLWEMCDSGCVKVFASRGVNGIDGQISTAMGLVQPNSKNWIVLGDLTTLYDFSGFWMTPYLESIGAEVNFVVVNNSGGKIFSRIFESKMFQNLHKLSFEPMAKMWGWEYKLNPENLSDQWSTNLRFIEFQPHEEQTQIFWERYDQLWKQ